MNKELREAINTIKPLLKVFAEFAKVGPALATIEAHDDELDNIESRRAESIRRHDEAVLEFNSADHLLEEKLIEVRDAEDKLTALRTAISLAEKELHRTKLDHNIAMQRTEDAQAELTARLTREREEHLGNLARDIAVAEAHLNNTKEKHANFIESVGGKR